MTTSVKSFIDVLFILLIGTIVLLSQSVRLGAVEAEPLRLGSGGVSPLAADDVAVVVVADGGLFHEGRAHATVDELVDAVPPGVTVLLVVADADVRHHRVMDVWTQLRQRGRRVGLGAEPRAAEEAR
jgi:biopolymer transport protein ExbD